MSESDDYRIEPPERDAIVQQLRHLADEIEKGRVKEWALKRLRRVVAQEGRLCVQSAAEAK